MYVKAKLVTICFSSFSLDSWSKAASVWMVSLELAGWAAWQGSVKLCILMYNGEATVTSEMYLRRDELHLKCFYLKIEKIFA